MGVRDTFTLDSKVNAHTTGTGSEHTCRQIRSGGHSPRRVVDLITFGATRLLCGPAGAFHLSVLSPETGRPQRVWSLAEGLT